MIRSQLLLALCLAGCATGAIRPDPDRTPRSFTDAAGEPLLELRGQIHVHTRYSHDSQGRIRDVLKAARATGCDFVIITDHNRYGALPYVGKYDMRGRQIVIMVGIEYSSQVGHLLDLFPTFFYHPKTEPQALVDLILNSQGFPVVAHPQGSRWWQRWDLEGLAGLEIYNMASDMREEGKARLVGKLARAMLGRHDAVLESIDRPTDNLRLWDHLDEERPWVGLAGSNAHGRAGGGILNWDQYENAFAIVSNRVWVRTLDAAGIEEGIRSGRVYVAFDALGDTAGFDFRYARGAEGWIMGEEVPAGGPGVLTVRCPRNASILLYRNGEVRASEHGRELVHSTDEGGRWRVELYRKDQVFGEWKPWVISNPIRISEGTQEP